MSSYIELSGYELLDAASTYSALRAERIEREREKLIADAMKRTPWQRLLGLKPRNREQAVTHLKRDFGLGSPWEAVENRGLWEACLVDDLLGLAVTYPNSTFRVETGLAEAMRIARNKYRKEHTQC